MNIYYLSPPFIITANPKLIAVPKEAEKRKELHQKYMETVINWLNRLINKYNLPCYIQANKCNVKLIRNDSNDKYFIFNLFIGYNGVFKRVKYRELVKLINELSKEKVS